MDPLVATYVVYLLLSLGLTVWVASMLSRHGQVFLAEVFNRNEQLASAVNQLLVVGFYLVNFGFVALWLSTIHEIDNPSEAISTLAVKLGTVALVIGAVHLANVWAFTQVRRRRLTDQYLRRG